MTSVSFRSLDDVAEAIRDLPAPDRAARDAAAARNAVLTKPLGALGRLEELALWLAAWQRTPTPRINAPQVVIFAGNHGVTAQGISAFPREVTAQMVGNFEAGGAAINQLAQTVGARLDVLALDLQRPTADFTHGPAMDAADLLSAINAGTQAVSEDADVLVVGEMGIGNTTVAAALCLALFGGAPKDWAGKGTGLDAEGVAHKVAIVGRGLATNSASIAGPLDALRCLGGREVAAMAGAMLAARLHRIPVVLDGFIASAAAAVLYALNPGALDHVVAGHLSDEQAHARLLDHLGLDPLLALGLRLGEGSGATLAISILQAAVACHSGMATFAEAGVSDG
ncbi:MAG: nicotinate-nucleotide--dimethylbenzimidazole phosphoribosyltransferase [Pseudomonadota bacterium]